MATMAERGRSMLSRNSKAARAVSITYTRGATVATLLAVVGRTVFQAHKESAGARIIFGERDYLIRQDEPVNGTNWTFAQQFGLPEEGDRITETINGAVFQFRCLAELGEPPWRWADHGRSKFRVHTKRVV